MFSILLMGVLSYYGEQFFPWWIIVVVPAFIGALFSPGALGSFICGFLGVGSVWFGMAWFNHHQYEGLLSGKVSELLSLSNPMYLILLTGALGGLVGGLGALSGHSLRSFFLRKKRRNRNPLEGSW
ncbi:MAG: hypothetical protein OXB93_01395 [Cytophagales bacterium]|nr:hypothetical protein [Cytophagales bacterium]